MKRIVFVLLYFVGTFSGRAQFGSLLNNQNEGYFVSDSQLLHTSFLPIIRSGPEQPTKKSDKSWVHRKLFQEHFLSLDTTDFKLWVDPTFNFEFGRDLIDNRNLYQNTRGIQIQAFIQNKLYVYSSFQENQTRFPSYITSFVDSLSVVPNSARVKSFKGDASTFDYSVSSAYLSYLVNDNFSIQLGHGKNFIGNGYRSLLLSDAGFNYPFLRLNSFYFEKRLQFVWVLASLQNLNRLETGSLTEDLFQGKMANFKYFDFVLNQKLSIGFFEGGIWKTMDSTGSTPLNFSALSPVPFIGLLSDYKQDNLMTFGLNLRYKLLDNAILYAQLLKDDNSVSHFGFQLGGKLKIKQFELLGEINQMQTYTLVGRNEWQSYTHYNQNLAHILGSGFKEFLALVMYRSHQFIFKAKTNVILFDSEGSNLLKPISYTSLNANNQLIFLEMSVGYLINPTYNLKLELGVRERILNGSDTNSRYVYFGFKTDIHNKYYDF